MALVLTDLTDGVATITLNDPDRLNALSLPLVEEALAAFDAIEGKARVIIITGSGRGFCAGANLADDSTQAEGGPHPLLTHFNPLIMRIHDSKVPIITKVRGPAAGYGASLALAGDIVIAADNAYFLQAFRNIGLVPDGGSAYTLVKSAGRIRATEMMLLGQKIPARTALEWGLVTRIVPEAELDATVADLARELAEGPTVALGLIRQMAWAVTSGTMADELKLEVDYQIRCLASADHEEGKNAFLEKRPAKFTGN
ncbi:MAG: enoyl-CoA hydratase-related protein [Sphingobium sp.]